MRLREGLRMHFVRVWGFARRGLWLSVLFWGLWASGCGVESNATSSSSGVVSGVFGLGVGVDRATVQDRTAVLSPEVSFLPRRAVGEVYYAIETSPVVDWFTVDESGTLGFAGLRRAEYEAEALSGVEDSGEGKAIRVVVTAVDSGRREASVTVTVNVVLQDFGLTVDPGETYVRHEEGALQDYVVFAPVEAVGVVDYQVVKTSPSVDWFQVSEGLLHFTAGEVADYDALSDEEDTGLGRAVEVTVRGVDSGRSEGSDEATAVLLVRVLPPPYALRADPSVVTIASGSDRLNASNAVRVVLENPEYLLGEASYTLESEGDWSSRFDIADGGESDPNNGVLSLNQVLDYHALNALQVGSSKVIQLVVSMEDTGRALGGIARQLVDVVVTLTSEEAPLTLTPSATAGWAADGEDTVTAVVLGDASPGSVYFDPNALGAMTYQVVSASSGSADVASWFDVAVHGQRGELVFREVSAGVRQTADYGALGASDLGSGRPVVVTVLGTDAGRTESNTASAVVVVDVRSTPLSLGVSPSSVSVESGSSVLPSVTFSPSQSLGVMHYGLVETSPDVDWFEVDAATGVLSLVRAADYTALAEVVEANGGKSVEVEVRGTDRGRSVGGEASATVEVLVTAASQLVILASEQETLVSDGTMVLTPSVGFSAQGASGSVSYEVASTQPSVSWFTAAGGSLGMTSAAEYASLAEEALNGVKYVAVGVRAVSGVLQSTPVIVRVGVLAPAGAFGIGSDVSEVDVVSGESVSEPLATFSASNAQGVVTYVLDDVAPSVSWFGVDSTAGTLRLAGLASYAEASATDVGLGKPVRVTVSAQDGTTGLKTKASVLVYVIPSLSLAVSPSSVRVDDGLRGAPLSGVTLASAGTGSYGSYAVSTEPSADWFAVNGSTGQVAVRSDRAVDWHALPGEGDSSDGGSKSVTLTISLQEKWHQKAAPAMATLEVLVMPAPLSVTSNAGAAFLPDGTSGQSTGIVFSAGAALGEVSFALEAVAPDLSWFAIDSATGDLRVQADATLSYAELDAASTTPRGRPLYATVSAQDAGRSGDAASAIASVIVYVLPPSLTLTINPDPAYIGEHTIAFDEPPAFIVGGAVGKVSYRISTSPSVDWFEADGSKLGVRSVANILRDDLPANTEDADGNREITVYITATDDGRYNTDNAVTTPLTVKITAPPDVRLELSATYAELYEKSRKIEPEIRYEASPWSRDSIVNLDGDISLCDRHNECGRKIVLGDQKHPRSSSRIDSVIVDDGDVNFWTTKAYLQGRGDDESIPLYFNLFYHSDDGTVLALRGFVIDLKNVPDDERITRFEGDELIIPEGDADDLFFFPISSKILLEASTFPIVSFEATDERFTLRDIDFDYIAQRGEINAGIYGVHEEPNIGFLGQCSFSPCTTGTSSCKIFSGSADFRLALRPGESIQYGEEPGAISITASIPDGDPVTAEFTVRVIERQDGTEKYPFIVDSANELRSIANHFQNDYTRAYCDILPTCKDGSLAKFQTRVSHYLQTEDIDLESNFGTGIGTVDGNENITFHGTYNGGGYTIDGLSRSLFALIGAVSVVEDVHLRGVDISGAGKVGGLVQEVVRNYSMNHESDYTSHRYTQLTLPYYDFYFAMLWSRFDSRFGGVGHAEVINSGVSGSVSGGLNTGGLVGLLSGGNVRGSYSTASVSASNVAGGLVGRTEDASSIFDSFASGEVVGSTYVGGLVGFHGSGLITGSFATGVPSSSIEGALLGALVGNVYSDALLTDSYGLGPEILVGEGSGERIYGASNGIAAWTCSDAPFVWSVEDDTCAEFMSGGGEETDFAWDFGTASEYPVPNYNVLTPTEIRALIPSPPTQ